MNGDPLPLYANFPKLNQWVSPLSVVDLPTPVESLPQLGSQAWIKRDDLTHEEYGGNKIRKLAFILSEAAAQGKRHIVTFGAIGTNHGVATAMLCKQLGFKCTIILFNQPVTDAVKKNLKLMKYFDAQLIYKGSLTNAVRYFYLNPLRLNPKTYFLFAGGSNEAGTLGFINAAYEIQQQVEMGDMPEPEKIICPVSSAATLAGLTLGCQWAGLKTKVIGVRVSPSHLGPFAACTPGTVTALMKKTQRKMSKFEPSLKQQPLPSVNINERYYGEGYGHSTAKADRAIERMDSIKGLKLDQTYSAKAFAAFLDYLDDANGATLFWLTYNTRNMSNQIGHTREFQFDRQLQEFIVA